VKFTKPSLIVLEGPDATGKSTQLRRLAEFFPDALTTHQPSGGSAIGEDIYHLTEHHEMEPLTRQLLHLAAHTEHYASQIIPALQEGQSVIMDRCWLSTFVYGHEVWEREDPDFVLGLVTLPTRGLMPDHVFLFSHTYKEDRHNTVEVLRGYSPRNLPACGVRYTAVPAADDESVTTHFIVNKLVELGFATLEED
jgi:dTMP kinase